jgi:hypothetical protein
MPSGAQASCLHVSGRMRGAMEAARSRMGSLNSSGSNCSLVSMREEWLHRWTLVTSTLSALGASASDDAVHAGDCVFLGGLVSSYTRPLPLPFSPSSSVEPQAVRIFFCNTSPIAAFALCCWVLPPPPPPSVVIYRCHHRLTEHAVQRARLVDDGTYSR